MKISNFATRSKRLLRKPLSLALFCALGTTVVSAQEIYLDRSLNRPIEELPMGQTAYTQQAGSMQMILGGSHQRGSTSRSTTITGRAEYGITDELQAQVEFPLDIADQAGTSAMQNGVSRVQVGALYNVLGSGSPVALSAGMDVEVPLGSGTANNVSGERPMEGPTYKPQFIVAGGAGPVTVHANAQAELGQPDRGLNYNVGSMFDLGAVVPSLEFNAMTRDESGPEHYLTPGVSYSFSDRAQIGVGANIGLNDRSEDVGILAKFSMNLGR